MYVPRRGKSRLIRKNKVMEQTFEPIREDFGDNLVNDIVEADWYEMVARKRTQLLGNQTNNSFLFQKI